MKAVVIHGAGDLRVDDLDDVPMGPNDVRVRIAAGGICGSDLHYFRHGGFGTVRVKSPMVLGHEIAGTVEDCGDAVTMVRPGQKVAVNPSLPCQRCEFCLKGLQNHCLDMRFLGSAMRNPHVQGGFREVLTCHEVQAVPMPDHVPIEEAAFAEPLAVALHAVSRAGSLLGQHVLITGSGPIGVLIAAAARRAGATRIVVTDVLDAPLAAARSVGADAVVNMAAEPDGLVPYAARKGLFDVVFEASGHAAAVPVAFPVLRPRGILVCVGQGAEVGLQMSAIVTKEVELRGAFRFHEEFATAVAFIAGKLIAVRHLLTDAIAVDDARSAFELAADKSRSMKVQLRF
jgi:L-idonate 5-dehydrogenase